MLSVDALQDRLAPVEPTSEAVRPMGWEGGVVSSGFGVEFAGSLSPDAVQPASATEHAARRSETFMRSMGGTTWLTQRVLRACRRIIDADACAQHLT